MIEAYGNKGMRNLPWRRMFKSVDALNAWCEKHDATTLGIRDVPAEEYAASKRWDSGQQRSYK